MTSVQENEDNFAEDECTMEFGEEDPPAEASSTGYPVSGVTSGPRFIEYPGEDFSMYLSDPALASPSYDEDGSAASTSGDTRRRYAKNKHIVNNNAKSTVGRSRFQRPTSSSGPPPSTTTTGKDNSCLVPDAELEETTTPMTSITSILPPPASPPGSRRKSTVRERVGRIFTTGQSSRRRSQSTDRIGLQNFTFADSKIGSMMLAQREQELAAQRRNSTEYPPETQSDLGVAGPHTWWDVGTLSSNRSVRLKDNTKSTLLRRRDFDPNMADDNEDERSSLFGSISKAVARARARRRSDAGLPESPSSPTATSSAIPTSAAAESTTTNAVPPPPPARSSQGQEVKVQGDGRGTRRGNLFKWLKDGVGPRSGEEHGTTSRKQSEGRNNQTNVIGAPRYTRIYDEMNRLTTDFRQSTVDNPLP